MPNEADTCRRLVVPKLQQAGWDDEPHRLSEQVTFTDGRIVVAGTRTSRRPGKRADYLLLSHELQLPPLAWQEQIAVVMGKIRSLADVTRNAGEELDALTPAILDRAFHGDL